MYPRATRMRARVYAASALSRRPILIIRRGEGRERRAVPAAGLLEEGIKRSRSSYPVFKAGLESEQHTKRMRVLPARECVRKTVTCIY